MKEQLEKQSFWDGNFFFYNFNIQKEIFKEKNERVGKLKYIYRKEWREKEKRKYWMRIELKKKKKMDKGWKGKKKKIKT